MAETAAERKYLAIQTRLYFLVTTYELLLRGHTPAQS